MLKKLFKTMEETKKIMEGELLAMINLKRYGNATGMPTPLGVG